MGSKSMLFAIVLGLTSLSLAQGKTGQLVLPDGAIHGDATLTCDVTYSSGTSTSSLQFCVTVNGNIPQFTIATQQMIGIAEGYGICDTTSNVSYFDYGQSDSGNWQSPTFTHSGNTVTIVRTTSDGHWKLTQIITNQAATATGFGDAKVSMKLQNLSSITRSANIIRYADVDADGDSNNHFDATATSAFGLEADYGHGLMITNNTVNINFGYLTFPLSIAGEPDPCNPDHFIASSLPFIGDGSIVSLWDFTLKHNTSATVVSTYKGI
jgi:hypothetical protein